MDVDGVEAGQKTLSNRRRKQPTASRKKNATASDNSISDASDATPIRESASKKRAASKTARAQLDSNLKTPSSAVRESLMHSFLACRVRRSTAECIVVIGVCVYVCLSGDACLHYRTHTYFLHVICRFLVTEGVLFV